MSAADTRLAAGIFFAVLMLVGILLVLAVGTLVRMVWRRWRG